MHPHTTCETALAYEQSAFWHICTNLTLIHNFVWKHGPGLVLYLCVAYVVHTRIQKIASGGGVPDSIVLVINAALTSLEVQ